MIKEDIDIICNKYGLNSNLIYNEMSFYNKQKIDLNRFFIYITDPYSFYIIKIFKFYTLQIVNSEKVIEKVMKSIIINDYSDFTRLFDALNIKMPIEHIKKLYQLITSNLIITYF